MKYRMYIRVDTLVVVCLTKKHGLCIPYIRSRSTQHCTDWELGCFSSYIPWHDYNEVGHKGNFFVMPGFNLPAWSFEGFLSPRLSKDISEPYSGNRPKILNTEIMFLDWLLLFGRGYLKPGLPLAETPYGVLLQFFKIPG